MAPLTKEEIERKRAEAMAAGGAKGTAAPARATTSGGAPNQSRLTLARAAIRPEMKGRVMLSGPAGAGKTYTSLVIATTLVGPQGRILVIDTEKESALTYADVFEFSQLPWNPPFDPTALSLTLKEAAADFDCIVVDSFSHFWRKQGGVLDIAGDNVRGWKAARPIQENLVETILDVDAHVIVCCRSKMEHLIQDNGRGGISVTKAGIKAQQDDDLEYEVNVALEIDMPHVLHIVKSRTNAVPVGAQFLAGLAGEFAQQYREWLAGGEAVADKADTDALREAIRSIEDDGLRSRAIGGFLDVFGRPEFLLVSRLPEAQQWVADVVAGTLPVDRAEDATPPEDRPGGDEKPPPDDPTPPQSPPRRSDPGEASGDQAPPPEPDSIQHQANVDGPAVFNGDTGHCSDCGGPIWFDAREDNGGPGWAHADDDDNERCPRTSDTAPAGPGVDVDALYAATHPPSTNGKERELLIKTDVGKMKHGDVLLALGEANLPVDGSPRTLKSRLVAHRLASSDA